MGLVRHPAAARAASVEVWATRWFMALGIALVVGVLMPIVAESSYGRGRGSRWDAVWLWNLLDHAPGRMVVALLLPLLLGIATLAIQASTSGLRRALTLFCCAAGTLLLGTILGRGFALAAYAGVPTVAALILLLVTLGGTSIAVGNRLRRAWSAARTPRLLAGLGGCGLCLAFLLPVGDRHDAVLLSALFDDDVWEDAWPLALWMLATLAYGVMGIVALRPTPAPGLYRATTVLGRCVLVGLPATLLLAGLLASKGEALVTALLLSIKLPAILYGAPGVLAVALTAWIAQALGAPAVEGGLRRVGSTAPAASAPGDLAARIARLNAARDAGLLSEAEYEVKRRQIIDSTDF